ncbi:MAG: diguanylate cyclase [Clostridia bacterium]|nr:diguanylate cyclase [Clostridia bacterium]MBR6186207.1 diguanylate cyclase [Clostridia bacterium]
MTPTGNELKPEEIRTAVIVSSALEEVDMDINVDYVRDSLSIEGLLTSEEENRKKAMLEKGEEYTMTPTNYRVRLSMNSSYSVETVQSLVTAIVNQYMTWYGNRYVITRKKPGVVDTELLDKYDYIISMDMVSSSIDKMLQYIYSCEESFRSSQTGLSFYDLQTQLQSLQNAQYESVYVKAVNSGITKDPQLLLDYYTADIAEQNLQREKLLLQADEMASLLQIYEERMLESQNYSSSGTGDSTDEGSNSIILHQVYEIYDEDHNPVYSQNNYETLMDTYAGYFASVYALEKKISEDEFILARFSGVTEAASESAQAEIREEIMYLIEKINSIYAQLNILGTEFNQSEVAKNIRVTSSARANKGVNIMLYMVLGGILFLGVGCTGAIVLGRAGDLMDYVLYTDKITGLPSRISCDEKIEEIAKEGALDTFSCVCLFVTNLGEINNRFGREKGNQMLAELGLILQIATKQYGFIGYNNGNQFLCLLNNSSYEKAKDMLDFIGYELEKSQTEIKPSLTAKIGESNRLSTYQINNLISATFKQEELIVFKPTNK